MSVTQQFFRAINKGWQNEFEIEIGTMGQEIVYFNEVGAKTLRMEVFFNQGKIAYILARFLKYSYLYDRSIHPIFITNYRNSNITFEEIVTDFHTIFQRAKEFANEVLKPLYEKEQAQLLELGAPLGKPTMNAGNYLLWETTNKPLLRKLELENGRFHISLFDLDKKTASKVIELITNQQN